LSFLRNIYDENERAAYVDNIILKSDRSNKIVIYVVENPNLLMHEIIFLIHTFDFQVALSISWDRVSLEEMTWSKYLMHAVIMYVLHGCLASSDLQAAFGVFYDCL
jgi:hypothetical protein